MLIDATKRKLQIPPKFVPYMEKFRLYELFHVSFWKFKRYQVERNLKQTGSDLATQATVRRRNKMSQRGAAINRIVFKTLNWYMTENLTKSLHLLSYF